MMTQFSMVAAVDENNGLGKSNQLLCHLPADLKYFKEITMGKPIIMGKNTFSSIGRPLPGRRNIVLTSQPLIIEGVEIVHSLEEALKLVGNDNEAMVIGGAVIFTQFLPLAKQIYLTVIHHHFEADVYFPQLDKHQWECVASQFRQHDDKNLYDMTFYQYKRIN